MSEKKDFWTDSNGIKRLIPSPKYPLTKTSAGRVLRRYILMRDNNTCRVCGEYPALDVDHIITRRYGGTHHPRNLQALCWTCNSRKGWFDRNPAEIIRVVKAVMEVLKDTDGCTLLRILNMLEYAKIVNEDATKRVNILIGSGIISGSYSVR